MDRYSRQTMLPEVGEAGQRRLMASSVLIVGLGGLGAPVAMYLTAAGVGRIGLVDSDTVGLSNLQRQVLYDEGDVGRAKTECAAERLRGLSWSTQLEIHEERFTESNCFTLVAGYDIVVDCTDNYHTRKLIDNACRREGRVWVHGAIEGFRGMVTVFNHKTGKRYADLYADCDGLTDSDRPTGTLGVLPGVVGSIQAAEVLKVAGGFGEPLDGRLLTIDLLTQMYEIISF